MISAAPTSESDLCPKLEPSTTYFVVVGRTTIVAGDVISLTITNSSGEHSSSATGWSIGDSRNSYSSGTSKWSSVSSASHQIRVLGEIFVLTTNATGVPTITGTPRVGEELTANISGISDDDGLTTPGWTYQWVRIDGMTEADITGATAATYTLTPSDGGKQVKVKVSFTDDENNSEGPLTSLPTDTVNSPATGAPSIIGVLQENEEIAVDTVGIADFDGLGAFSYQWIADGTDISGATSSTYTLQAAQVGANISVRVSFTDTAGDSESLTSAATPDDVVASGATRRLLWVGTMTPATLAADVVGFNALQGTLTPSSFTSGSNTYILDGVQIDASSLTILIAGVPTTTEQARWIVSTGTEFAVADASIAEVGGSATITWLTASISWTAGTPVVLSLVEPLNTVATGFPTITGAARVHETLTADTSGITDADGIDNVTFEYQWVRVSASPQLDIPNATDATYTLTDDDVGERVGVKVSFTDDRGNNEMPAESIATDVVAAEDVLVTNNLRSSGAIIQVNSTNPKYAQRFTAGASLSGYTIASASIHFSTIQNPASAGSELTVTLNADSSGAPGSVLCTLTDPGTYDSSAINTYDASSCPTLAASTTYFVVLSRANANTYGISLRFTNVFGQNSGSAPGWSIGDKAHEYTDSSSSWAQYTNDENLTIEIKGEQADEIIVPEDWSLIPSGLTAGTKFRLMFITYTGHSSASTDIENYNAYVQSQANASNAHAAIKAYSSWFRVLGSTATVDARDNTATTSSDTDAPIYWMNGAKIADNYADLYNSTWDSEAPTGRQGTSASTGSIWTGSDNDGTLIHLTSSEPAGLGNTKVGTGTLNGAGTPFASGSAPIAGTSLPYYALSGIFVVPLSAPTGEPVITGTPRVGEVLTTETSSIEDSDGLTNPGFEYQWVRVDGGDEANIGTDSSTYTLTEDDAEHTIRVKVSFTDDIGIDGGPLASEATDTIAPSDLLVRNTTETSNGFRDLVANQPVRAQAFTTGAVAAGYELASVGFLFHNIVSTTTAGDELVVTLNSEDSGDPDEALCTLEDPLTFSSSGLHTFKAPTTGANLCPTLTASTTYFAVLNRATVTTPQIALVTTASSAEHAGSVADWSIGDDRHFYDTAWNTVSSESHLIEVKGTTKTNTAPEFDDTPPVTRSVPENTASGENIGDTVSATDTESDTLVYALTGTDAGSFTIDSSSGQLKTSASLDFETKNSFSVNVTVHDGKDATGDADTTVDDTIAVTINVTNVDEAGTVTLPASFSGGVEATASVSDPDGAVTSPSWQWARGATATGSFTDITGATSASYTPVTADLGKYLRATVTYKDPESTTTNKTASAVSSGTVGGSNSAPTFDDGDSTKRTVPENSAAETNVGAAVAATDSDSDTLTYTLTGTDAGSFTIDSDGQIKTKAGITYNFEDASNNSFSVTANVSDSKDAVGTADTVIDDTIAVTIDLTNVNEAPEITNATTTANIAENSTAVITVAASDVDASTTLSWSVESTNDGGKFAVSSTGVLTFKDAPNFEMPTDVGDTAMNNTYVVTVKVTDDGSPALNDTHTFTITVTNVNEAPVFTSPPATANFAENGTGTVVDFDASDVDASSTLVFSVESTGDGGKFNINSSTGVLTFKNAPDFEMPTDVGDTAMNNTYAVTVKVEDNGSPKMDATHAVKVTVTNVNEAPEITTDGTAYTAFNVDEGTATSAVIKTYEATDADADSVLTWSLEGNDAGDFTITKNAQGHGELKFANVPDHESPADSDTDNVYDVTVKVQDNHSGTLSDTLSVAVTVDDVDETPAVTVGFGQGTYSVDEGGTVVVKVVLNTDPKREVVVPLTATNQGGAANADYSGVPANVTFQSGDTEETFTITATQDTVDDDDESVKLTFGTLPARVTEGTTNEATVSITDDDDPEVTVSFGAASYTAAEGGTVDVKVVLNANPERSVTIPLTKTDEAGATSADYSGVPTSVTFVSGDTEETFTFTATQDTLDDDDESVKLGFGTLPTRVTAGTTNESTVSITDDDAPAINVSIAAVADVTEGQAATFTLTRDGDNTDALTVTVSVTEENGNYISGTAPTTVAIAANSNTATLSVPTDDDNVVEGDGAIVATVQDHDDYDPADPTSATVNVSDNDEAEWGLSPSTITLTEGGSSVTVTASIKRGTTYAEEQTLRFYLDSAPLRSLSDIIVPVGSTDEVTLPAGDSSVTLTLSAVDNDIRSEAADRQTYDLGFRLVGVSGYLTLKEITIIDDEGVPEITLAATDTEIAEGADITLTATLDTPYGEAVSVTLGRADTSSVLTGTVPTSLDFAASTLTTSETTATATVTTDNDTTDEADATVIFSLSSPTSPVTLGSPSSVTITVQDNDGPPTAPANLTAQAGDGKVTLNWGAASSESSPVEKYQYRVRASSSSTWNPDWTDVTGGDAARSQEVTSLTNGRNYTFEVRAINATGNGNEAEVMSRPFGKPDKPSVTVQGRPESLYVSWSVSNDGGSQITEYQVQWAESGQSFGTTDQKTGLTSTNTLIGSLTNFTTYDVRVRAMNAIDWSDWSNVRSGTPTPRPPPSVSITASVSEPVTEPFRVTITFTDQDLDGNDTNGVTGFEADEIIAWYTSRGNATYEFQVTDFRVETPGRVYSALVDKIIDGKLWIEVEEDSAQSSLDGQGNTLAYETWQVDAPDPPPAPEGAEIWSAMLTVGGQYPDGYGLDGKDTGTKGYFKGWSPASTNDVRYGALPGANFTYGGESYEVLELSHTASWRVVRLRMCPLLQGANRNVELRLGNKWVTFDPRNYSAFEFSRTKDGSVQQCREYDWDQVTLDWQYGQSVNVRITR